MRAIASPILVLLAGSVTGSAFLLPAASTPRRAPSCRQQATAAAGAAATGAAPLPLLHQLQSAYPRVPIPPDFLAGVQPSDSAPAASANEERALVRARTFASLAPRALLARGLDIISEDFVYYSPSTGHLSRAEYMGLVSVLERVSPDLRLDAAYFRPLAVGGGGAVSFVSKAQGTFSGELVMGDLVVPGKGATYEGDLELSVVAFDAEGLLQSLSTGVVVPEAAVEADAELRAALTAGGLGEKVKEEGEVDDEAVVDMKRRLESQAQKLSTTPAGTMAWDKITADMAAMRRKVDAFQREGELRRWAGGHGGLGGILFALGVEQQAASGGPGVPMPAEGLAGQGGWQELDDSMTMDVPLDFITVPSECETLVQEIQRENRMRSSSG